MAGVDRCRWPTAPSHRTPARSHGDHIGLPRRVPSLGPDARHEAARTRRNEMSTDAPVSKPAPGGRIATRLPLRAATAALALAGLTLLGACGTTTTTGSSTSTGTTSTATASAGTTAT